MPENNRLSLSELQRRITNAINYSPDLQQVWVMAELSDVRVAGGHCYMELIEKDERSGQTVAKLRAMIWNSNYYRLNSAFKIATQRNIQTGLKVLVCGSVSHHQLYGISFTITNIDPSYTLGDLERLRREILERLMREGKLGLNRQLPFPATPQRVAVISAAGAAGYGDFMDHLMNSPEGFKFYPFLFQAVMQGERTPGSVLAALEKIEQTIDIWDCVVIIRGGGATTDLNGFDNYELAERVATFPLPVVVGIGHERDRTVLDEIACVRCKTPTAVADFLVERVRKAESFVLDCVSKIARYCSERLNGENLRLANLENLLPARVNGRIVKEERNLDGKAHSLERIITRRTMTAGSQLELLRMRMENALKGITERPAMRLKRLEDMLRVLSPENTMSRGYSITRVNGHALYDPSELRPGDEIVTQLLKGEVRSKVTV